MRWVDDLKTIQLTLTNQFTVNNTDVKFTIEPYSDAYVPKSQEDQSPSWEMQVENTAKELLYY